MAFAFAHDDPRVRAGFLGAAVFGLATGLLEGPWSVATTGAPFAALEWMSANGHHAWMIGLLAAHNLGVAATLPALGGFLRIPANRHGGVRADGPLALVFGLGLLTLAATAIVAAPKGQAWLLFVLEVVAVLALAVPWYRGAVAGRAHMAPWCGFAVLAALGAAMFEVSLVA